MSTKSYKEALDLAATHAPFDDPLFPCANLERWIALDVQQTRNNPAKLSPNDITNASVSAATDSSAGNIRREEIAVRATRVKGDGSVNIQDSLLTATDACDNYGERGLDFRRCN